MFAVGGISVYLHWSWLVVAYIVLRYRTNEYQSQLWNVAEYLSLFGIVLMHEFGHALACRQVGGTANEIVLWPLGGIAFVHPPPRPGAVLWSIAAGPLVNVVLVPITIAAVVYARSQGWDSQDDGPGEFLFAFMGLNIGLLIFNILPIYPLDGGQILQALLWFVIGRSKSLLVVCVIGLVASLAGILLAFKAENIWIGIVAGFAALRCWAGFQQARTLAWLESAPRHREPSCPSCGAHPLAGEFWQCDQCGTPFDTFTHQGQCPNCHERFPIATCPECGRAHPLWAWHGLEGRATDLDHEPPNGDRRLQ